MLRECACYKITVDWAMYEDPVGRVTLLLFMVATLHQVEPKSWTTQAGRKAISFLCIVLLEGRMAAITAWGEGGGVVGAKEDESKQMESLPTQIFPWQFLWKNLCSTATIVEHSFLRKKQTNIVLQYFAMFNSIGDDEQQQKVWSS